MHPCVFGGANDNRSTCAAEYMVLQGHYSISWWSSLLQLAITSKDKAVFISDRNVFFLTVNFFLDKTLEYVKNQISRQWQLKIEIARSQINIHNGHQKFIRKYHSIMIQSNLREYVVYSSRKLTRYCCLWNTLELSCGHELNFVRRSCICRI